MEAAQQLLTNGAELIIAGCTEVSLVMTKGRVPCPVIDPMEVLARVAIERARAGGGGESKRQETSEAVRAGDDMETYSAVRRGF
jgi:Asp/Glu/hydantoin racemase